MYHSVGGAGPPSQVGWISWQKLGSHVGTAIGLSNRYIDASKLSPAVDLKAEVKNAGGPAAMWLNHPRSSFPPCRGRVRGRRREVGLPVLPTACLLAEGDPAVCPKVYQYPPIVHGSKRTWCNVGCLRFFPPSLSRIAVGARRDSPLGEDAPVGRPRHTLL